MNICIAVKIMTHPNGGVCTHIIDLCQYYSLKGHNVILLADGTDYKEITDQINGLTYINVPFSTMGSKPFRMISIYKQLRDICKQYKIEIIHLHGQSIIPIAWLCKLTMGIPFLWTNHIDAIPQPKIFAFMRRIMRFPIISVSDELKNDLIRRLNLKDKNLFVVYNGINFSDYYALTAQEKKDLKNNYNIYDDEFVIVELARLTYGKGQDLLIRAVNKLQQKYPERKLHVLFAGSGDQEWFEENVISYAQNNNIRVSFLGFQKPRDVFGVAHISVLPSIYEGFALTVIESIAMGCPAIRSDTPGWSVMKEYCMVFQKGNLNELTELLERMMLDYPKWKTITLHSKNELLNRFSKERMGEDTLAVYKQVLDM